ncbi:MAG TPA: hypothetical protein VHE35_01000 [Kofleriaceae bacterium]|nr:hypothetical protein [Kofleriaceae bacterium]
MAGEDAGSDLHPDPRPEPARSGATHGPSPALDHAAAARELSWFAIRQPAIIRFLERRLWAADGDAFAVALDAACRLHEALTLEQGLEPPRVTDMLLREGTALEPPASLTAWVEAICADAPVMLTPAEEAQVVAALGAVAWGLTAARGAGVGELILG